MEAVRAIALCALIDPTLFQGKNKEILDAELWAISDGLKMVTTLNNHNTSVTIFSDSREALTAIRQPTP